MRTIQIAAFGFSILCEACGSGSGAHALEAGKKAIMTVRCEITEATLKRSPYTNGVETRLNLRITNSGAQELRFGRVGVQYFADSVKLPFTNTTGNQNGPTTISVGKSVDIPLLIDDSKFVGGSKKQLVVSLLAGEEGQTLVKPPITVQVPADSQGMYEVGVLYSNGQGSLPQDKRKAAELYQKAVALDENVNALLNLGTMFFNGQGGLPRDEHKAKDLFQRAANRGNAGATAYLGFMYENGKGGLVADKSKASALYEQAAKLGDTFAKEQLQRLQNGAK